jgi:hypothetical protein
MLFHLLLYQTTGNGQYLSSHAYHASLALRTIANRRLKFKGMSSHKEFPLQHTAQNIWTTAFDFHHCLQDTVFLNDCIWRSTQQFHYVLPSPFKVSEDVHRPACTWAAIVGEQLQHAWNTHGKCAIVHPLTD